MRVIRNFALCFYLVAGGAATHVSLAAQSRSVAIRTGRILDVKTGTYALQQMIWIEGDRIKQIGSVESLSKQLPAGTPVMDLSNVTVHPKLIDAHTHLTVSPQSIASTATGTRQSPPASNSNVSVRQPTELAKQNARITVESGFTSVRDVSGLAMNRSPASCNENRLR